MLFKPDESTVAVCPTRRGSSFSDSTNKFRTGTIVTLSQLNARQRSDERQLRHSKFTTKIVNHPVESLRVTLRQRSVLRILFALHPENSRQRAVLRRFTSAPDGRLVQVATFSPIVKAASHQRHREPDRS